MLAFSVVFVASAIQGSIGFGANVVTVPLLALLDPALVPGPVLLAGFGVNVLMLLRDRRAATLRPVRNALAGRVAGTVLGAAALTAIGPRGLALLVAVTVLGIVAITAVTFVPARTTRNLLAAGTLSGFSASTAGIGGPPVALFFQDADGPEIRGSLGAFFVVGNIVSLTGLALVGRFGTEQLRSGAVLIPAALLGFLATRWVLPVLDRGYTRPAILSLSAVAAVALIGRLLIT